MTVALYARVSTTKQSADPQLADLRRYCDRMGWTIAGEYADEGVSGTKDSRPALNRLMGDARALKFEVVLCWRFDRFARSALHLLRALDEFKQFKIRFVSMTEGLDTGRPMGEAVLTILGALGKLERDAIAERVRLGQVRAREKGVRFGRPLRGFEKPRQGGRPKNVADPEEMARRRAAGQSWRAIARALKVPLSTVRRRMTACRKSPTEAELLNRYPVPALGEADQRAAI